MTTITDAKRLLNQCQGTENEIYDLVSIFMNDVAITFFEYHSKYAHELQYECSEIAIEFTNAEPGTSKDAVRQNLWRMAKRLEAAVLYVKTRIELQEAKKNETHFKKTF